MKERIKDESIRKNEIEDIDKDTSFNDDTTLTGSVTSSRRKLQAEETLEFLN